MAHIETGGGKGRKISLDLNLVPFIDLMSVLITFLLITAVWSQVSMMQIGSSLYGKKSEQAPQMTPEVDVVLKLEIRPNGYLLTIGSQAINIPMMNGEFDDLGLTTQLERAKQLHPTKVDAAISMADNLPYERLIKAMDGFLKTGFPQISVLTGGPN